MVRYGYPPGTTDDDRDSVIQWFAGYEMGGELDATKAFNQQLLDPSLQKYIAFSCPRGPHCQAVRSMMGEKNATACWCLGIRSVIYGIDDCRSFIDNVYLRAHDECSYQFTLAKVLKALYEHNIVIGTSLHGLTVISVLGSVIDLTGGTVTISEKTNAAVSSLSAPRSLSQLRSLIGMIEWAGSKSVPALAEEMAPITDLLTADPFLWTAGAQTALVHLKEIICQKQILVLPAPGVSWRITSDASDIAEGAVLDAFIKEKWSPVQFWSHKFTRVERAWSTLEKEAHAMIVAL